MIGTETSAGALAEVPAAAPAAATGPDDGSWGDPLRRLVSRYGVVNALQCLAPARGLPGLQVAMAMLGAEAAGTAPVPGQTVGGGRALGAPGLAEALALAEAAERYAARELAGAEYTWASQDQLPGRALDLRQLPQCTDEEYANHACPVRPYDESAVIRWVRGVDFPAGEPIWIPACMATYRLPDATPAERFWYAISTGFAVHSDPVSATLSALAEVVERDAIALLWLQRLALPRIPASMAGAEARTLIDWCADHFVTARLFDATTDLGLPTVYCVLTSPHDQVLRTLVGCGTGMTVPAAAAKALIEAITLRLSKSAEGRAPTRYEDFREVADGARYMAVAGFESEFDFLLADRDDRPLYRERGEYAPDPLTALRRLGDTLQSLDMQAVLVDRTSAELAEVGLVAVRAVVPALQPMSLRPLARFTRHPRLYSAPLRMGYRALPPDEVNPLPQPFA